MVALEFYEYLCTNIENTDVIITIVYCIITNNFLLLKYVEFLYEINMMSACVWVCVKDLSNH